MKIVIVGCGRVGASVAEAYDRTGHQVTILDIATSAFDRLPATFGGIALRGDGTDEDVLLRAGAEGADVFLAVTEGDNRNVMAAQLANEALGIERVIAKINDPVRAKAYAELGIATLCRTGLMQDAIDRYLGLPPTGLPGMLAPSGHHDAHAPIGSTPPGTTRTIPADAAGSSAAARVTDGRTPSPATPPVAGPAATQEV